MLTAQESHATHHELGFIKKYIFSVDHKVIGIQYLITSLFVGLVAGVLAMLVRLNLAWPAHQWPLLGKLLPHGMEGGVMKPEFYVALFTMHGTLMVFFFLSIALVGGFG